jgi:hypothetical protein
MFAMRGRIFFIFIVLLLIPGGFVLAQEEQPQMTILSPTDEEVIFGIYPIVVQFNQADPTRYEIEFSYAENSRGTWFPIAFGDEFTDNQIQYEWDTNQVTDGNYNLRVIVYYDDGASTTQTINTVRIRNYSQVETPTPTLTPTPVIETPEDTLAPTITPSVTPSPTLTHTPWRTPTPLPRNPIEVTDTEFRNNLGLGAAITLGGLSLIGIYTWLRRRMNQ